MVQRAGAAAATGSTEPTLARVQRTKTLRIGAVRGAAPYYNKDLASGEWGGFMIDFAKSLAASLNVKLDITETTWGNSVLDLQTHKIDLFFGMNPTPARREVIGFTEPLFLNAFTIVSKKEFKTWADLNKPEVKIAVDIGSSHDQMISRVCPNATIVRLEKADDATLALQTGRVDAQVLVWLLASGFFEAQADDLLEADAYSKRLGSKLLAQLRALAQPLAQNSYGQYLLRLADEG